MSRLTTREIKKKKEKFLFNFTVSRGANSIAR